VPVPPCGAIRYGMDHPIGADAASPDSAFEIHSIAQGALFRCQRRGISVPHDLALAGFNDLPASAWTVPSLTTIATPRYEIGRQAAQMRLGLLPGEQPAQPHCDLGFELMAREST
jgi:LacI family transcriptional regulator, gluconate utilization system Gnt-I transcriptional repressor